MEQIDFPKIYVVMGVSGSGKSTVGKALAAHLELPFFDGDDFHPPENVAKMAAGNPLDDTDREGWLRRLNQLAVEHLPKGAVIACSALKESYRGLLEAGLENRVEWVVLLGSYELIHKRMAARSGHYMPPALLKSQFEALEVPAYGIHLDIGLPLEEMMETLLKKKGPENPGPK